MNKQTQEALKMAIEALQNISESLTEKQVWFSSNVYEAINACKEALDTKQEPVKSKVNKYLGLVNLESEFPLTEWERKEIIKYSMECLLEEGELGKLGMLCHKFEETIRHFENKNPVKEFLNNKELYTRPTQPLSDDEILQIYINDSAIDSRCDPQLIKFARAIEQAHGIGVKDDTLEG